MAHPLKGDPPGDWEIENGWSPFTLSLMERKEVILPIEKREKIEKIGRFLI